MSLQSLNQTNSSRLLTDSSKLLELLVKLLQEILKTTNQMPKGFSHFHSNKPPSISIPNYLARISKFFRCSSSCYVIALAYIDQYQDKFQTFFLNKYSIHKFLLVAMTVAAKFNDDLFYKNSYYAKVGGISVQQLNNLQIIFLQDLDYQIFIKTQKFRQYLDKLAIYDQYMQ